MQPVASSLKPHWGDTEPTILVRPASGLMLLYGCDTPPSIIRFFERLAAGTRLAPKSLQIDKVRHHMTARQAITRLTRNSDAAPHILLCTHGSLAQKSGHRMQRGDHMVTVNDAESAVTTRRVLQWIKNDLAKSGPGSGRSAASLPFIHLFSCQAGAFRKQLKPGSALWRSAYVMVYASKRNTSLSASGSSISTAISYVDWCERQRIAVDPLKMMALAGLRRGECLTLMGGDLSAPLVWHAPKSEADLSDENSLDILQGDPDDVARLRESFHALTSAERGMLPATSLRSLLSNRMERDNTDDVKLLLEKHPELLDASDEHGVTPLIEAIEKGAKRCVALLLEHRCDPNKATQESTPLTMCVSAIDCDLGVLELLLEHKADPNLKDPRGFTALMLATDDEWQAGIMRLLQYKARMDLRDPHGLTSFEDAALSGKSRAVSMMLAFGAGEAEGLNPALIRDVFDAGHEALAVTLAEHLHRLTTTGPAAA